MILPPYFTGAYLLRHPRAGGRLGEGVEPRAIAANLRALTPIPAFPLKGEGVALRFLPPGENPGWATLRPAYRNGREPLLFGVGGAAARRPRDPQARGMSAAPRSGDDVLDALGGEDALGPGQQGVDVGLLDALADPLRVTGSRLQSTVSPCLMPVCQPFHERQQSVATKYGWRKVNPMPQPPSCSPNPGAWRRDTF